MNSKNNNDNLTIFDLLQKELNNDNEDIIENSINEKRGITYINEDDFFRNSSLDYFRQSSSSVNININDVDQENTLKYENMICKNKYTKDDFEYLFSIGKGAYGSVFKVRHINSGKYFAIKEIEKKKMLLENKNYQIYIENEILNKVNYPGIVKIYGFFQDNTILSLVEEYCCKGDLCEFIESNNNLSIQEIQYILGQIILCVEYLNSLNIIHRDIKPENFFINHNFTLKLGDFATATYNGKIFDEETLSFIDEKKFLGIDNNNNTSKSIKSNNIASMSAYNQPLESVPIFNQLNLRTQSKDFKLNENYIKKLEIIKRQNWVGTAEYMSPEVINNQPIGDFTDIWSVICIAYKLFKGTSPFKDKTEYLMYQNILRLNFKENSFDNIPNDAKDLITSILKINPYERYGFEKSKLIYNFNTLKKHPFFIVDNKYNIKYIRNELIRKCNISLNKNIKQFQKNTPFEIYNNNQYNNFNYNRNFSILSEEKNDNISNNNKLISTKNNNFNDTNSSIDLNNNLSYSRDQTGAKILKLGILKKRSPYLYYDKRKIILLDTPRIDYYQPDTNELKGTILLDKKCSAELVSHNQFYLQTPSRTYSFMCKEKYDISPWVNIINKAISDYGIN